MKHNRAKVYALSGTTRNSRSESIMAETLEPTMAANSSKGPNGKCNATRASRVQSQFCRKGTVWHRNEGASHEVARQRER